MPRGIWKGTLGFGLVTIGVELLTVENAESLDLDLLDNRDMGHIGYQKINKTTGKTVPAENIVKGFDVGGGKYVILDADELKAANPRATQTIDILGFVPANAIPPLYFAKPYLLAPTKGSAKAYALFRDTLEKTDQMGVAQVVVRTRQYVAAVYPWDGHLMVQLLRYEKELRLPAAGEAGGALRAEEKTMAKKLVEGMAIKWQPSAYHDEYREDLLKLIKRRARGAKQAREEAVEAPQETKVIDLVAALKKSLAKSHPKKSTAKKSPSRRSA